MPKRKNPVTLHIGTRKRSFDSHAEAYRAGLSEQNKGVHSVFVIVDGDGKRAEYSRAGKKRNPKCRKRNPDWFDSKEAAQREADAVKADGGHATVKQVIDRKAIPPEKFWIVKESRRKRRRNPEAAARSMREAFTGLPSEGTIVVTQDTHVHEYLALLGPLVELRVKPLAGSEKGHAFDIDFSRQTNPRGVLGKADKAATKVGKPIKGWLSRRAKAISGIVSGIGKTWVNPTKLNGSGQPLLCSNEKGTHMYIEGGSQEIDIAKLGLGKMDKESVVIGPVTYLVYHARKKFDGKEEEHDYRHRLSEEDIGPLPTLRYDIMNKHLYLDGGSYRIPKPLFGGASPGITN